MRVHIDALSERRLWAFIRALKTEVGGMGYAYLEEDGSLDWRETFLIPQEVSSTEVDFESTNGDQIAIEKAIEDGVMDDPSFIWVSWHSHHTMNAYWSGTDDKRIAAMRDVGVKRLLSFVGCHDKEYKMRLDIFGFQAHGILLNQVTLSDLKLECDAVEPDDFTKCIGAELDENVKERKFTGFTGSSYTTKSSGSKKGKKSSKDKSGKGKSDDIAETFETDAETADRIGKAIVKDLVDDGYSHKQAEEMLANLGASECEEILQETFGLGQLGAH